MPGSKAAVQKRSAGSAKPAIGKAIKGAIFGLIVTILSVLVLAIVVKQLGLSDEAISAINQAVKVLSIFVAAFIATNGLTDQKILTGCIAGALYVLFGFGAFSLIEGQWGSLTQLLADLAMGIVIGMLTAMIFSKIFVKQKKPQKGSKR